MDDVLGLLGLVLFIVCVIALAAAVTWLVVKISPPRSPKKPSRPSLLDRRERQDVLERRVLEAVRLGDGFVRDLPVEHVDALRERRVAGDRLARARCPRSPRRTAASRS